LSPYEGRGRKKIPNYEEIKGWDDLHFPSCKEKKLLQRFYQEAEKAGRVFKEELAQAGS